RELLRPRVLPVLEWHTLLCGKAHVLREQRLVTRGMLEVVQVGVLLQATCLVESSNPRWQPAVGDVTEDRAAARQAEGVAIKPGDEGLAHVHVVERWDRVVERDV